LIKHPALRATIRTCASKYTT